MRSDSKASAVRRERGFTLVELLAALTLISVIAGMVFTLVSTAGRVWDTGESRAARTSALRLAHRLMRNQLSHAITVASVADGSIAFEGAEQRLVFVQEIESSYARSGIRRAAIEYDAARGTLTFSSQGLGARSADASSGSNVIQTVMVESLARARFDYFGAVRGERPRWQPDWSGRGRLPLLVRLRLELEDGRAWPPLVVMLHATGTRGDARGRLETEL